jgi:pilus assembly protein CpaB
MNRNRLILIGLLALGLAGFLTVAAYRAVSKTIAASRTPMTGVVVADRQLQVGSRVDAQTVRIAQMPTGSLPEGVFTDVSQVVGRGVLVPMQPSEVLLSSKLALENAGSGLPSMIPERKRAVSVKVNEVISVAGFVGPGAHVDVLLTGYPDRTQAQAVTTTVLENVEVLAAGRELQQDPAGGKPQTVNVITLLVTPDDAQRLALASSEGKIQLSLRNPLDTGKENPIAVRNVALYRMGLPPVAPASRPRPRVAAVEKVEPPPPYVVEMIRGDKRDVAKF